MADSCTAMCAQVRHLSGPVAANVCPIAERTSVASTSFWPTRRSDGLYSKRACRVGVVMVVSAFSLMPFVTTRALLLGNPGAVRCSTHPSVTSASSAGRFVARRLASSGFETGRTARVARVACPSTTVEGQCAEVPRKLLALPQDRYLGPGWDLAPVLVPRAGSRDIPLNFMLDSALTTSMLAPHVARLLGLDQGDGSDANGQTQRSFMAVDGKQKGFTVRLEGVHLDCAPSGGFPLGALHPLVVEFPQSRIGQELGCPIDGMLGMEFYERFAVEISGDHLRLHEATAGKEVAAAQGMEQLTTAMLPARLLGVEVGVAGSETNGRVHGILDTGAAHTVLNTAAARELLGLSEAQIQQLAETDGGIGAYDVRGALINMPLIEASLELRGAGVEPRGVASFSRIEVAIGDIALFAKFLGGDTQSPAALIGQDLLVQRPMLLAARQCLICFG